MKLKEHKIDGIEPGSIAEEMGIEAGDVLLEVNGKPIQDVFDYHFLINDVLLTLLIRKPNGEEWELEIEKDYYEDPGIVFENGLMDDYKSCYNKCIFCFIDQMPPNMRETLYFKDDDSRLSFLQGNYVTLTNMKDEDADRIIRYKLAPINVSVHTMNPELRCEMLHNRFAGEALDKIRRFYEGEIEMNGQIVLCKNYNDGDELERTISDLTKFMPYMQSVSVVPMGMTKYREGLAKVEPFNAEDAGKVIDIIERWQKKLYDEYGTHFIQAGDELYLMAGRELPEEERYDGYIQLENGVGMMRLLIEEFKEALEDVEASDIEMHKDIVTGKLAYPYIQMLVDSMKEKFPNVHVNVHCIINHFFGETITVTGLITGQDVIAQLKDLSLGTELLMPINMLRSEEEVLLDDVTISDIENALQVKIRVIQSNGKDLIDKILI